MRVVATRFSSAKPAPDGACVRSPEHPPGAVGAAADLEGDEVQVMPAARRHADQRPQPFPAAGDQARRQMPSATSRFAP